MLHPLANMVEHFLTKIQTDLLIHISPYCIHPFPHIPQVLRKPPHLHAGNNAPAPHIHLRVYPAPQKVPTAVFLMAPQLRLHKFPNILYRRIRILLHVPRHAYAPLGAAFPMGMLRLAGTIRVDARVRGGGPLAYVHWSFAVGGLQGGAAGAGGGNVFVLRHFGVGGDDSLVHVCINPEGSSWTE